MPTQALLVESSTMVQDESDSPNDDILDSAITTTSVLGYSLSSTNKLKISSEKASSSLIETRKPGYQLSTWGKIVKTLFLITAWVCIGLTLEITGPTLKDLKLKTRSSYEDVSRAVSGRSLGFFTGAAIGGVLVDKLPRFRELMIAICLDGMAVMIIIAPHVGNAESIWALLLLGGTFEGVINIAGQKLILVMWLDKASSPMHALHLGFGVGSFIVPQIANPFLAVPAPTLVTNLNTTQNAFAVIYNTLLSTSTPLTSSTIMLSTTIRYLKDSHIEWAYVIVSLLTVVLSIAFYGYQFCSCGETRRKTIENETKFAKYTQYDNNQNDANAINRYSIADKFKSFVKIADPGSCTGGRRGYGIIIFVLLFLYFFTAVGGERLCSKFIRTFAIDQLHFDGDEATLVNTAFWISFSCGRFAGFLLARWIPIRLLMIIEASGCVVIAILLNIFAHNNQLLFWVFSIPMAFFIAPLFPTGIAWGNFHIDMTGMAITLCLVGGGLGGVAHLWIIGYLYDHHGYQTFLYQLAGFAVCALLFGVLLDLVGCGQRNRFVQKTEQNCDED